VKRPHRSIETFDISLMAVVTKAMGAFLVLMLLLMPYYSSSPLGKDEAQELARKVQDADQKIKGVLDKLGEQDLGKDLVSAREELGSGAQLINQLKRYVDQLSAQVTRQEKIATLTAELEQLKRDKTTLTARVAELEKQNADLKAENEQLKAEIERLKKRIAELEKLVEEQKARIAELEAKIEELNKEIAELRKLEPERVEELKRQIEELKKEIARLKQQIEDLNARVAALEDENTRLRARVAELEQQNAQLNAMVVPLQQENAALKAKVAELEAQIEKLKSRGWLAGTAQSTSCNEPFVLGLLSGTAVVASSGSKYLFNHFSTVGNTWLSEVSAGTRVSTVVENDTGAARYFLYLIFRNDEDGPLLEAQGKCTAFVTIMAAIRRHVPINTIASRSSGVTGFVTLATSSLANMQTCRLSPLRRKAKPIWRIKSRMPNLRPTLCRKLDLERGAPRKAPPLARRREPYLTGAGLRQAFPESEGAAPHDSEKMICVERL
jgi:cell division protein FtsB